MSGIGHVGVRVKGYRLPKRIQQIIPELLPPEFGLSFQVIPNSGHTFVRNSPPSLQWTFDPITGKMYVEGINTDRYLNFEYRGSDGHMIENLI